MHEILLVAYCMPLTLHWTVNIVEAMITSKSVSVLSNAVHGSVLMVTVFTVLKKTLVFKGEILWIKHLKVDSFLEMDWPAYKWNWSLMKYNGYKFSLLCSL